MRTSEGFESAAQFTRVWGCHLVKGLQWLERWGPPTADTMLLWGCTTTRKNYNVSHKPSLLLAYFFKPLSPCPQLHFELNLVSLIEHVVESSSSRAVHGPHKGLLITIQN